MRWTAVDVTNIDQVARALGESRPTAVYHCAGIADVHSSWSDSAQALRVNVMGTHAVLEGLRRNGLEIPVVVTGSALVYRRSTEPMTEESVEDVLAGRPLLGAAAREALLDDLRVRRESLTRALTPFERLTPRERRVLGGLAEGLSADEIATSHYVSLTTVRSQIRGVLCKLGVRSQLAAVAHANRAGWAPNSGPLSLT